MLGVKRALLSSVSQSVLYADLTTGIIPSWLVHTWGATPTSPPYYFDAAGNLQTAPNNLIRNSAVFATQTAAVTSGASYILSATMASGNSIAVTGGATTTLSGTGTGSRVYTSFVASSASVTLTLTGAAIQAQLEQVTAAQTAPNPYMPTSGAAYFGPVVNDHNPSILAPLGARSEPQRANLLANNTAQGASLGVARTISGVTAITRTASASAVILAGTTNVAVGDLVTLSGATPSTYNGAWVVTAATPNVSFTVLTATSATDSASGYAVAATSPGTPPTGFQNYSGGGVALVVKNIATLNGVPIVDIQVAGVTTGTYTVYALNAQITSVTTGQRYTHQLYAALVGGSLTNVSSVRTATRASMATTEITMSLSATLAPQPAATYTITGADTYTVPSIDFYYPSAGLPVNFTLRLALEKFEQNAFATSPILTYGAAVTVPADIWTLTGAALARITSGNACVAIQVLLEGQNNGTLLEANDGTFSNRVYENFNTASQTIGQSIIGGAQQQSYSNTGGSALTAPRTAVIAYGNGAVIEGYDGTAPVSLAQSGRPPGMTTAQIGSSNLGAPALYGWFSQIMIRPSCTAAQVQAFSTVGANLRQ